ncbi:MAG: hypothetical protein LUQ65_00400 [Candidatus Helarchaeota archaeon]|nr:hypothetical protein [Candidatus Helarchaeota archaeon]
MKVGIVSDGKYGERAFENIKKIFPCQWILIEEIPPTVVLDDYELTIPDCDLYLSYVRHPDQVMALVGLKPTISFSDLLLKSGISGDSKRPVILGVSFGPGFLAQAQKINPKVVAFPTMCSLQPTTGIPEIDEFARHFGRPEYETIFENGMVSEVKLVRSSPCGSSAAGAQFIKGKPISTSILQEFAINVCHECRAPRFGRTCDKELSGLIHLRSLLASLSKSTQFNDESVSNFITMTEQEYQKRLRAAVSA